MITGQQIQRARKSLGWTQKELAAKAKVPLSVVVRAENSPGEPLVKIAHGDALLTTLRAAGAVLPLADERSEL